MLTFTDNVEVVVCGLACDFKCVSVFYRASDKCQKEKRKTINGDDLIWSLTTLGFEDYIEPLKAYLIRYREVIAVSPQLLMISKL